MPARHYARRQSTRRRRRLTVLCVAVTMLAAGCGRTTDPPSTGAQPNPPIDSPAIAGPSAQRSASSAPVSALENRLRQIAATAATPHYYLGAEFAGEDLADVTIFDDASGAEVKGDRRLDPGQTLVITYGKLCSAQDGMCNAKYEITTEPFRPERYDTAVDCARLASLRGVPTVQQADAVSLFTTNLVIRLGNTADAPQQAAAAAALREASQDKPTGANLPPPPGHIAELVDKACGRKPGDKGPTMPP
jgi:hypothetical protein